MYGQSAYIWNTLATSQSRGRVWSIELATDPDRLRAIGSTPVIEGRPCRQGGRATDSLAGWRSAACQLRLNRVT
jgi:hypothetical protein